MSEANPSPREAVGATTPTLSGAVAEAPAGAAQPAQPAVRFATIVLASVCVFWGATFLLMELGTEALRRVIGDASLASAALFLVVRFVIAVALLPLLVPNSVRRLDRAAWREGLYLSLPFSIGFILQVFGLTQEDMNPSQSAFLTSLYVVVTPIIAGLMQRRLPPRGVVLGVPVALFGAAFISGPPAGGLSVGAWSTIASAVAFAAQIVMTDTASRRADPMALTLTMLVYSVGWLGLALVAAPGGLATLRPAVLIPALSDPTFVVTVLLCAVLATVVALAVLNRWQKEMHPSRAALVYTSEPVFAAIISIIAARDRVTGWLVLASVAILVANLLAALVGEGKSPEPRLEVAARG